MEGVKIPPEYVNSPIGIIYDPRIPDGAARIFLIIYGFYFDKRFTPRITMDLLSKITGEARSTIYGHMAVLRNSGWLLFNTAQDGTFMFQFLDFQSNNLDCSILFNHLINNELTIEEIKRDSAVQISGQKMQKESTVPAELLKPIIQALSNVTNMDLKLNYSRLAKEAKAIHLAGYKAEQILGIYGEDGIWWEQDWRGQKGEQPQLGHIKLTIQGFVNSNGTVKSRKSKGDKTSPDARKKYAEWGS